MNTIGLLVYILILTLVFGVIWYVIKLIPLDAPIISIVRIIVAVIFVLALLGVVFGAVPLPRL